MNANGGRRFGPSWRPSCLARGVESSLPCLALERAVALTARVRSSRSSPGQGPVVPAGVRSVRWGPPGFSSKTSSRLHDGVTATPHSKARRARTLESGPAGPAVVPVDDGAVAGCNECLAGGQLGVVLDEHLAFSAITSTSRGAGRPQPHPLDRTLGQPRPPHELTVGRTVRRCLITVPGRLINRSGVPSLCGPRECPWAQLFVRRLSRLRVSTAAQN